MPPCPENKEECKYRNYWSGSNLQKNALRIESGWSVEKWRCGYLLKDSCIGGHPLDYFPCLKQ